MKGLIFLIIFNLSIFSDTLKLKEAIDIVLKKNPEIISSYEKLKEKGSRILPSFIPPNPRITLREMFMEENISIMEEIPIPTKLITEGLMAKDEYKMEFYLYKAKILEIIREVKENFYEYYFINKKIEITKKQIEIFKKMKEISERRYESGLSSLFDPLKSQIELEKMKNELSLLESEKTKIRENLKKLLNIEEIPEITEEVEFEEIKIDEDSLIKVLYEKNPLLKAMEYSVRAKNKEKILTYQNLIPDPMPEVLYNTKTGEKKIALSFEIPLFFREFYEIKEKKAKLKSSKWELLNTKLELKEELSSLISLYKSKLERLKIFKDKILPKAEESFISAEAGYISGKLDFLFYLESEKMLYESKIDYLMILTELLKIKSKIEEITGGEL
ncbi:MAG: TolC family protein [Candidatus Aenigmatarchaeota archaeon]